MGRRASKKENAVTTGLTTLGEVLRNGSNFNPAHFLYLPMDEVWQAETKSAVLLHSDLDGVPEVAQQNGLSYALGIAAVQDIVANAKEQNADVGLAQLIQASLFYYDHDAFINFGE